MPLPGGSTGARELSSITCAGGARYYAVSDKLAKLFPLSVELDAHSGAITHAAIETGIPLLGSTDLEGVAYDPEHATVLVSDEVGPALREYRVADGRLVRTIPVPPEFTSARNNLSLEETLGVDGPLSSMVSGSLVRLQRFDRSYRPTASGPM